MCSSERDEQLLTREELAERLGVRPGTVGRWTQSGRIPARRLTPKVVRYDLDAVVSALEATQKIAQEGGGR